MMYEPIEDGKDKFALMSKGSSVSAPSPGFHLAFSAPDQEAVDSFYSAAIENGGIDKMGGQVYALSMAQTTMRHTLKIPMGIVSRLYLKPSPCTFIEDNDLWVFIEKLFLFLGN